MSDEDRKAFEREMADDTRFFLRNDEGVYRYEDIRLAWESWQASLAWERGRQNVLWEGYLKISSDGLGAIEFSSPTNRDNAVRVKIVEAE